jgi:hypothetical protein
VSDADPEVGTEGWTTHERTPGFHGQGGGGDGRGFRARKVASEMFARRGAKVVVGDVDLKGAEQTAADVAGAAIRVDVARY